MNKKRMQMHRNEKKRTRNEQMPRNEKKNTC